ncbi:hypothetical protein INT80_04185 [Gallibacterium anatis]|uniref:Uncharacterized protein n=1 Tax=Gallibacterium anatis TaxID=750 RepID=A0A930YA92_9PAST|nr:hypothetical protein [Gallibacterium anatis]
MGLTASNLSFSASCCSLSLGRFFNASSAFVFASFIVILLLQGQRFLLL